MTTRSLFLTVISVVGASMACRSSGDLTEADQAAIRAADSSFHAAINAGDVERVMAFYAADGTVLPANTPPFRGTQAVREFWTGMLGMMTPTLTIMSDQVAGNGNIAYHIGSYHFTARLKDSAGTALPPEDGKYVQVFARQADGSWKAVADAWSANAAAAPTEHD